MKRQAKQQSKKDSKLTKDDGANAEVDKCCTNKKF